MAIETLNSVWPDWQIEKQLGQGSYGVVYQAVRKTYNLESRSAIKVISIPSNQAELDSLRSEGLGLEGTKTYLQNAANDFIKEVDLMGSLRGIQNIVSVEDYAVVEHPEIPRWDIFIRMELLTPFSSYTRDKTLAEEEVIKLGSHICDALEICSQRNIIHRDIKPENIFINDFGHFKLGDFGIARKLESMSSGMSQKGSYNYMAPEVAHSSTYDHRVDIYSLGLVLYRLLNNNRLPFLDSESKLLDPEERKKALDRRLQGEALPAPCCASPAVANVILQACAFDPNARFSSAAEMKRALLGASTEKDLNKTWAVRKPPATPADVSPVIPSTPKVDTFGPQPTKTSTALKIVIAVLAALLLVTATGLVTVMLLREPDTSNEDKSQIEEIVPDNKPSNDDTIKDDTTNDDTTKVDTTKVDTVKDNTPDPDPNVQILKLANQGPVHLRSQPSQDSASVTTVDNKTLLYFYGDIQRGFGSDGLVYDWYRVKADQQRQGWVRSDMVQNVLQPTPSTTTTTQTKQEPSFDPSVLDQAVGAYLKAYVYDLNNGVYSAMYSAVERGSKLESTQKKFVAKREYAEELLGYNIVARKKINNSTYHVTAVEDYNILNKKSNSYYYFQQKCVYVVRKQSNGTWKLSDYAGQIERLNKVVYD